MAFLDSKEVNLFEGIFKGVIEFKEGLNLISGENGTCKTHLLREIKTIDINPDRRQPTGSNKIYAISPKRNSARTAIHQVLRQIRSDNHNFREKLQKEITRNIEDSTFQDFLSITEIFAMMYDELCKRGKKPNPEYAEDVIQNFNTVISKVFSNYKLVCAWDEESGTPKVEMIKNGSTVPLDKVSCGEQEMFSLMLNLYVNRERYELFLIDEPEVHLNWNLEEKVFQFLLDFANNYGRQLIVTTHSRMVFKEEFLRRTQFLVWNEGKITCLHEASQEIRERIAGESIVLLKPTDLNITTFFVEDYSQKMFIRELSKSLNKKTVIIEADNKRNVKTIFKLAQKEGWKKCHFVIDGDNEGNPFPNEDSFIHLEKYCIENYLLDIESLAKLWNKSDSDVRNKLYNTLLNCQDQIFKNNKNKFFKFLFNMLKPDDITQERLDELDGSLLVDRLITCGDKNKKCNFFRDMVNHLVINKKSALPRRVLEVINTVPEEIE